MPGRALGTWLELNKSLAITFKNNNKLCNKSLAYNNYCYIIIIISCLLQLGRPPACRMEYRGFIPNDLNWMLAVSNHLGSPRY